MDQKPIQAKVNQLATQLENQIRSKMGTQVQQNLRTAQINPSTLIENLLTNVNGLLTSVGNLVTGLLDDLTPTAPETPPSSSQSQQSSPLGFKKD
ncbi:C4-type Zn-finger protein [Kroppenstedtia sanguinis]|uniref:Uncharacterized protein n=1 Tax=Kroppenstedtia sanguinis TaxID=1380684 RepID=A0ABW4C6P9_9BACL